MAKLSFIGELVSLQSTKPDSVPSSTITQTAAMRNASFGIVGGAFCRCKFCKTYRCPCKKASRGCNTKCHKGQRCFNKT